MNIRKIKNPEVRMIWWNADWTGAPSVNIRQSVIWTLASGACSAGLMVLLIWLGELEINSILTKAIILLMVLFHVGLLYLPFLTASQFYAADKEAVYYTLKRFCSSEEYGSWFSESYENISVYTVERVKKGVVTFTFYFKQPSDAGALGYLDRLAFISVKKPEKLIEMLTEAGVPTM